MEHRCSMRKPIEFQLLLYRQGLPVQNAVSSREPVWRSTQSVVSNCVPCAPGCMTAARKARCSRIHAPWPDVRFMHTGSSVCGPVFGDFPALQRESVALVLKPVVAFQCLYHYRESEFLPGDLMFMKQSALQAFLSRRINPVT